VRGSDAGDVSVEPIRGLPVIKALPFNCSEANGRHARL
jgi:hypothetical protein